MQTKLLVSAAAIALVVGLASASAETLGDDVLKLPFAALGSVAAESMTPLELIRTVGAGDITEDRVYSRWLIVVFELTGDVPAGFRVLERVFDVGVLDTIAGNPSP